MKIKKQFDYCGVKLRIVERDEPYMNGKEPLLMTRVMAPNGGIIPVNINHRQTLKSITEETIRLLDGFKARGANVIEELTKSLI
jgi:hypothetical protein